MRGFIGKLIIFAILSIFLYRQRHYLLRLVIGIEAFRRLTASLNFKWMDVKDWMRGMSGDQEMDHF